MKLGVGTYTFTWAIGVAGHEPRVPLDAVGLLERAVGLGVRLVQIADNLPMDRMSAPELDAIRKKAVERGIELELGTRGIAPGHLSRYLEIAGRLESSMLRTVVDTAHHRPDPDEVVETLRSIVPALEQAGVRLAIENHDRFSASVLAGIIRRIGSDRVGVCLDTVNSLGALEGPDVVVETLGSHVINLHIKDFTIFRQNHMMGFIVEGRPAGEGMLDVPWLLNRLRATGQCPNAILELWTPPGSNLDETMVREAAWADQSVRYLRRFIPE